MSSERDSYKQIFKTTSIFGGIQVFNILIVILKSKVVAVLLGPAGLGIISIFNSTSTVIASCTNLGINVSAVKSIALTNQVEQKGQQSILIAVVKKLIWVTGLFGFLLTIILSPWLSQISFGNSSYTFSFALLGCSLLALHLSSGQIAILQGLRQIKLIAYSSLIGSFVGLLISIPLYYILGTKGIVPAIVTTSMAAVLSSWYFLKKAQISHVKVNYQTVKKEGKEIVRLGFLISFTSIFPALAAYVVRLFISNVGDLTDVGLYSAGFAIVGTYVGMVFSAMSTDYYPSLSEVSKDNIKCTEKVNQQILVSILILVPILITLIVFVKMGIIILYSEKFLGTVKMIQWASLGVFFQAFSWCIAFLFLAKGDSKVYFLNELIPNLYILLINCFSYYIWGLEGLGISYLIGYIIYSLQVYWVAKKRYDFYFDSFILKRCAVHLLLLILTFLIVYYFKPIIQYTAGSLIIAISVFFSINTLEKKTNFLASFRNRVKKNKELKD